MHCPDGPRTHQARQRRGVQTQLGEAGRRSEGDWARGATHPNIDSVGVGAGDTVALMLRAWAALLKGPLPRSAVGEELPFELCVGLVRSAGLGERRSRSVSEPELRAPIRGGGGGIGGVFARCDGIGEGGFGVGDGGLGDGVLRASGGGVSRAPEEARARVPGSAPALARPAMIPWSPCTADEGVRDLGTWAGGGMKRCAQASACTTLSEGCSGAVSEPP